MNTKILWGVGAGVFLIVLTTGFALWQAEGFGGDGRIKNDRMESRYPADSDKNDKGHFMGQKNQNGQAKEFGPKNWSNQQNCLADDCLSVDGLEYPVATLPDATKEALLLAIEDEYKALAFYQAVIGKFGSVRPFSMIIRAEEQHISSLKSLFDKYGMTVPENSYFSQSVAPETLSVACQMGVNAENANAALYQEKLLPVVSEFPDITNVFTHLMGASQERHLPAFERCQ